MKLSIKDITSKPDGTEINEINSELTTVDYSGNEYQVSSIKPFSLSFVMKGVKELTISGESEAVLEAVCDRCLTSIEVTVPFVIEEHLEILDGAVVTNEDIGAYPFVDGDLIDVDELIYGEIIIGFPAKLLCKDDCLGLCLKCGKNKNIESCSCDDRVLDPRMAQFLDFLK